MKKLLFLIPFILALFVLNNAIATETVWGMYEFTFRDMKFSGLLPATSSKDPIYFHSNESHSNEFTVALPVTWAIRSTGSVVIGSTINSEDPEREVSISLTVRNSHWTGPDIFQDMGRLHLMPVVLKSKGGIFKLLPNGYEYTVSLPAKFSQTEWSWQRAKEVFTTAIWFEGNELILRVEGSSSTLVRRNAKEMLDSLLINDQKLNDQKLP